MDANHTRYHLLLGPDDWGRARNGAGERLGDSNGGVRLDPRRHEATLWQKSFRFGARAAEGVELEARRGAARDRFGSWYWIAENRRSIRVRSSGSGNVSAFWPPEPPDDRDADADEGAFQPQSDGTGAAAPLLSGLAITEDHYLAAGSLEPPGLLVFDLYAGGPPRQLIWRTPFAPFDLATREGGGVWILDADQRRVWELDRRFEVVCEGPSVAWGASEAGFRDDPVTPRGPGGRVSRPPLLSEQSWPLASSATPPIALAAVPGRGVLVLEADDGCHWARVRWLEGGRERGVPVSLRLLERYLDEPPPGAAPGLVAHDMTFAAPAPDDDPAWLGRLYVVGADGNQAFGFGVCVTGEQLVLEPITEFYPMRLFGGRALATAGGEPWYDSGDRWVPLLRQHRPRFVESGELRSPVLDSGLPGCVWHRVMLDACIPPGAGAEVFTRASDDWRDLVLVDQLSEIERRALGALESPQAGDPTVEEELLPWRREPPPYLRADGPELPFLPREPGPDRGTWELLIQDARGRYGQVKLVLKGDGRATPRIRAMRVWFPRFSYLEHYLPAVYREDEQSASFLDRFLANMEGTFTTIEDRIAAAQLLFDVDSAPPDALEWLAAWLGVALDPAWEGDDHRRRLFIRNATRFFALRGTARGLQIALRLALDSCVDEPLFASRDDASRRAEPIRIIERFRARRTPLALLGGVNVTVPTPRPIDPAERWKPATGRGELNRRYRESLSLPTGSELPLSGPGKPEGWEQFVSDTLGFVPRAGAEERAGWAAVLAAKYPSAAMLNAAHGSALSAIDEVRLPTHEPAEAARRSDWIDYLGSTPRRTRQLFQEFLARRYRTVQTLNDAWGQGAWSSFAEIPVPDSLPADGPALADWFVFEASVLAMHATAHRFTVMLPAPRGGRTDTPEQLRRLDLARAVLRLEKPAHTVFDVRYYWAMFRVGEARLGSDTVVDLGSRAPELMAPMVLGRNYLAESYLAAHPRDAAPERMQIGRDRLGRSTRVGGP